MKKIYTIYLILITNTSFAYIYNLPAFFWEIQQQYANERHDIVKIKLEDEGFILTKSIPDYDEGNKQYKSMYTYNLNNPFQTILLTFITTTEDEVISYEINSTINSEDNKSLSNKFETYYLDKPAHKRQRYSWIYDTTLVTGRRGDKIFSVHPLYMSNRILSGSEKLNITVIVNKPTIPIIELTDESFNENPIEEIRLKKMGQHYFITVRIGPKDYIFLFDTGATDFLINKSIEKDLLEKGIIKKEDYLGFEEYEIANGQKVKIRKVRIKKLRIGNITITDMDAGILENNSSQPLFPISALNKFHSYKINNKTGILTIKQW